MEQWHQVFLIVRCPSAPSVEIDLIKTVKAAEQIGKGVPTIARNVEQEFIATDTKEPSAKRPPQVKFEYIPVACIEHRSMYGLLACRRLYDLLSALSSPQNRRAIGAEVETVRGLGIEGVFNMEVTPCPYTASLCYSSMGFDAELAAGSSVRAERHTVTLNELQNDSGITVIDVTDPNYLRYAFVYIKPDGIWGGGGGDPTPAFMTPLSAELYLSGHQIDDSTVAEYTIMKLKNWQVLDVYTLDSAFPGYFDEGSIGRYDPEEINRDPVDYDADRKAVEEFIELEMPLACEKELPSLRLLAAKGALVGACVSNDSVSWLEYAISNAPTALPIIHQILRGQSPFTEELSKQKGFGRVLKAALPYMISKDDQNRLQLDLSGFKLTEENLNELFASLRSEFPFILDSSGVSLQLLDMSNQPSLMDKHISFLPTIFPSLKTIYLINNPKITVPALSALVSSYVSLTRRTYPPRLICTQLFLPFYMHPDSHFGGADKSEERIPGIPDPDGILKPSTPFPTFTTQIVWSVPQDNTANTCHASLIHPFDVLVGLYNLVAAYANRDNELESQSNHASIIAGAFGVRAREDIKAYKYDAFRPPRGIGGYGWFYDGMSPFVRQRSNHLQDSEESMDDALGRGEWRLCIRMTTCKEREHEGEQTKAKRDKMPQDHLDHPRIGRRMSVAFFRARPDNSTVIEQHSLQSFINISLKGVIDEPAQRIYRAIVYYSDPPRGKSTQPPRYTGSFKFEGTMETRK